MEKMDDLGGVPLFLETPIFNLLGAIFSYLPSGPPNIAGWNIHIFNKNGFIFN